MVESYVPGHLQHSKCEKCILIVLVLDIPVVTYLTFSPKAQCNFKRRCTPCRICFPSIFLTVQILKEYSAITSGHAVSVP